MHLSKVQAALLRTLTLAAQITGTPRRIPIAICTNLCAYYFHTSHVRGALRELERIWWLTELPDAWMRIAPDPLPLESMLPGECPIHMGQHDLEETLRRHGLSIFQTALPAGYASVAPPVGNRKRWLAILADHLFVEQWYGGPLSATLSREVFIRHYPTADNPISKRSQMSKRGWLAPLTIPDDRRSYTWIVTQEGIAAVDDNCFHTTFTTAAIQEIAERLKIQPLEKTA